MLRAGRSSDHAAFVTMFAELGVDDPVPDLARFERDLMPNMIIAERGESIAGYAYWVAFGELAYIRHLVVMPAARRSGVGQELMGEVRSRARAAGCSAWTLKVLIENDAAIRLYEKLGMVRGVTSTVVKLAHAYITAAPTTRVRPATTADDGAIETTLSVMPGLFADGRKRNQEPLVLDDEHGPLAAAIFDVTFPSLYSFRANAPAHAFELVSAVRDRIAPDSKLTIVHTGDAAVVAALIDAGAEKRLEMFEMRGDL